MLVRQVPLTTNLRLLVGGAYTDSRIKILLPHPPSFYSFRLSYFSEGVVLGSILVEMTPPIQTTQDPRPPNPAIPNVRKLSWAQIIRPRSAATIPNPVHTGTPTPGVAQSRPAGINGEPLQAAQSHTRKPSSFGPGPLIEDSAAMPGNTPANRSKL